eukprot:TRINITY_DN8965_c0_g1_i1.p1 TRINITY_DN8965_c0_g1~~TRINITY_DN8965_c0_g1_i1.p1  ORF type:complete len:210 (+),score=-14.08 TRINITY_DN8965_c0_g1_i1:172-801(+)
MQDTYLFIQNFGHWFFIFSWISDWNFLRKPGNLLQRQQQELKNQSSYHSQSKSVKCGNYGQNNQNFLNVAINISCSVKCTTTITLFQHKFNNQASIFSVGATSAKTHNFDKLFFFIVSQRFILCLVGQSVTLNVVTNQYELVSTSFPYKNIIVYEKRTRQSELDLTQLLLLQFDQGWADNIVSAKISILNISSRKFKNICVLQENIGKS